MTEWVCICTCGECAGVRVRVSVSVRERIINVGQEFIKE